MADLVAYVAFRMALFVWRTVCLVFILVVMGALVAAMALLVILLLAPNGR